MDVFVAVQPPAFGDIRKKCALACGVFGRFLIDVQILKLTTNIRLLNSDLIIRGIDLLELQFEPVVPCLYHVCRLLVTWFPLSIMLRATAHSGYDSIVDSSQYTR